MGQAALAVARKGWPVFPCDHRLDPPGQKRCKRPLTSNGFKDSTSDPVQIEMWWRQFPSAMIGVPSGSRSGFWALDPDVDEVKGHNGPAELARLEAEHGELPRCLVPESGGAFLTREGEDALWQQVVMVQPARRREFEPSSKRRKRRPASSPPGTA